MAAVTWWGQQQRSCCPHHSAVANGNGRTMAKNDQKCGQKCPDFCHFRQKSA
eukprot:NODE_8112_length_532_cov_4.753623_g7059_i0.p4 GENE.NODE_8112_length_532_cov_4.753623_g7059_i0~~NODE_8112_length_532_cov_4.753623_g7059_i0.p4  ORF type:complete len:52 (+),score=1.38 NODE_8112_length_532_cov_4.753623_g7059_i0:323-478(+)